MEPEVRYTWIGATLVALVAALVLTVIWLRQAGTAAGDVTYEIVFARQSLEGLQVGGNVNMRGIRVGQVVSYSLSRNQGNRVNVLVRVARDTPVAVNTVAVVSRNILTGLARINLITPEPPGEPLVAQAEQRYPVIGEGTSTGEKIEEVANRLAESGVTALEHVGSFLDADNKRAFTDALVGVRNVTYGLEKRLDRLDHTLAGVDRSVAAFGRASEGIAKSVVLMRSDFNRVATQADSTLRDVSATAGAIDHQASALVQRLDAAAGSGSLELRATTQQLRVTAELLDRTLSGVREPRALIFGPNAAQLGPGEKAK